MTRKGMAPGGILKSLQGQKDLGVNLVGENVIESPSHDPCLCGGTTM